MEEFIPYYVLICPGRGEITEKKSKFIANVAITKTEEEAAFFIEEMKKQYWDARHNCFASVIGHNNEYVRCSDDGEPSGTAGRPILEVIQGSQIKDITIVVTRYFGGVLLGTGGLVRAYTQAAKEGLKNCKTGLMRYGVRYKIFTDYNAIGKIQYLLAEQGVEAENTEYTDMVSLEIVVPSEKTKTLLNEVIEATNGRAEIKELRRAYFVDKNVIV